MKTARKAIGQQMGASRSKLYASYAFAGISFEAAKAEYERLCSIADSASKAWRAIPGTGTGPMGLTPEHIRLSPEFVSARRAYERAEAEAKAYASPYLKHFKAEIAKERAAKWEARATALKAQ